MNEEIVQNTKDQHYVPQFYLKKFVNKENKLEILDCERRKMVQSRSPKSVCNEEYYYSLNGELDEVSQDLEKNLSTLETSISGVYDEIAKKFTDNKEITLEDKLILSTFMSVQYLRGPYMRKQIKRMDENMVKQLTKLRYGHEGIHASLDEVAKENGIDLSEKERQDVISFALKGNYSVETNNATHLNMLGEMEGFRNLLYAKEWKVYISKSKKKFVTSDNPVLELFPEWTGKFFFGPTFLQRTHVFTMTPEILIVTTHPRSEFGNKIKRKTLFDNKEHNDQILELNFMHPRNATAFCYAKEKESLQEIVDSANLYDKQRKTKFDDLIKLISRNKNL